MGLTACATVSRIESVAYGQNGGAPRVAFAVRWGFEMLRRMCKSKIHRAVVTSADLDYEGSIAIDTDLLEAADVLPYEMVQVFDINNGARFETYTIPAEAGSGTMCVNGAAARLVQPGDLLIVISYTMMEEKEARGHKPLVVFVNAKNKIVQSTTAVPSDSEDSN